MPTGLVLDIQRYSIQDGPGIRTTVFLKGCPARCWWCHNPESQSTLPEIMVLESRCLRCGACVDVCPEHVPSLADGNPAPTDSRCTVCGDCVGACPSEARILVGKTMSVDQVMEELLRDRLFFEESGGGLTVSGGEPLMQPEFLKAILESSQAESIRTAVDTCGFASWDRFEELLPITDLFLYDLKMLDRRRHLEVTGIDNGTILENLTRLSQVHPNVRVRIPLIPGINDHPAELDSMAEFLGALTGVRRVDLLPYHQTGAQKFDRLGLKSELPPVTPPSSSQMESVAGRFRHHGLEAFIGGREDE